MSREFGESYSGGFFHNKISAALEDAQGGHTTGAKIAAAILKPLADIAYAISFEEAYDSSESSTVRAFVEAMPDLKTVIHGIESYIAPATELAASAVADVLESLVEIRELSPDAWTVRIPGKLPSQWRWELRQEACRIILRKHVRKQLYWRGSSSGSGIDGEILQFAAWEETTMSLDWLNERIRKLEQELALAKAMVPRPESNIE